MTAVVIAGVAATVAVVVSLVWGRAADGDNRIPRPTQLRRRQLEDVVERDAVTDPRPSTSCTPAEPRRRAVTGDPLLPSRKART